MCSAFYEFMGAGGIRSDSGEILMIGAESMGAEIKGKRVFGIESRYDEFTKPGCFRWELIQDDGIPKRMTFSCPCGCGSLFTIMMKPFDPEGFVWDTTLNQPTLNPIIETANGGKPHWRGFLTKGVFCTYDG
jgi:hypothetical protein